MNHAAPRWALLAALSSSLAACGDDAGDPDAGFECPSALPAATVKCDVPGCTPAVGSATKTMARAELSGADGTNWLVISYATSEFASDNENTTLNFEKRVPGGLLAGGQSFVSPRLTEAEREVLYSHSRLDRVRAESRIRRMAMRGKIPASSGTAISGVRNPNLQKQSTACSTSNRSCGETALCIIPEGQTDGTCESQLSLKYALESTQSPETISATVRKVGSSVAIVVDDEDASKVSDEAADTLIERFENHIAPLDHAFFGNPAQKDRDGNGVTILLMTSKLRNISTALAGVFFSDDMRPTSQAPHSNAADMLYLQPPGADVNLDQLSGTIAHEYQHILNYTSKVIVNQNAEPETVWLDEGLSTFAEDVAGYGEDSFKNIIVYLEQAPFTSLTGFGTLHGNAGDADSNERRGMAHLMVRYLFEGAGGATFADGPGSSTDKGGIARVKQLVESGDTGFDVLKAGAGGRNLPTLLGDFLTTVGVDGTGLECIPGIGYEGTSPVAYTGFVRGVRLRGSVTTPGGMTLRFMGPRTDPFENAEDVDFPLNGGDFRTVQLSADGRADIRLGGPAEDIDATFRVIALP